jgi:hypothetical protein
MLPKQTVMVIDFITPVNGSGVGPELAKKARRGQLRTGEWRDSTLAVGPA